ncbi:hypothetical protein NLB65_02215 [Candidatus Aminicenantes bacterium AC-335-B20]|jgi:hypothetical protein|nr:hypothetical protein [SCandidatus Aminicenantes bacterium Aminicenantia_JdfR_composite]MCP2597466.1 hypothetical protein [Candidatus Aminicenantes bacterium AC-335-G13]MCP2598709.1 hypothetical protein [Candidatus Aminicenantes bacterium AC-335-L06]MCP2599252.1 hypothetical protein [Candidatus Aminicenantes bacterium AC-335-B20]MCP2618974.1 hypothetical protein [Candidatus Aminicenantes bacterium AC-335-A11]
MKVIFKNTVFDILLSKATLYTFLFGSFFTAIAWGLRFIVQIGSQGNYQDISFYQTIIYFHIILSIYYVAILVNTSSDLEEEVDERFHEVTLIYISRWKYFFAKYLAYLFSYLLLLLLIGNAGAVVCRILLKTFPNWRFFIALAFLSLNIAFLISLFFIFALAVSPKESGFFTFFLYILFSLLNSKSIMNWIVGSDKITEIVSFISPSIFWLQNEFLRFGMGWELSDKFWQYLLNVSFYLILLLLISYFLVRRYECKA